MLSNRGIIVFAWTVDDPPEADTLIKRGVAGITSNNLDLLANLRSTIRRPSRLTPRD